MLLQYNQMILQIEFVKEKKNLFFHHYFNGHVALKKWSKTGDGEVKWTHSRNDDDDTKQRHRWLRHMKMNLYNVGMWQTISMLFIDQLKTSDNVHIEQALIDDKKEEETWSAFRQLLKRRRSFCVIGKRVLCTKRTTTFIIVRIAGQVVDLNALTTMAMVPLSTFVHLLKDNLSLENWNVWIDHPIVTMVFFCSFVKTYSHSKVLKQWL